jgi:hypothetical protein
VAAGRSTDDGDESDDDLEDTEVTEGRQKQTPWLKCGRRVQRRKSSSVRRRGMKSSHTDAIFGRRRHAVFYGILRSAEFF